MSLQIFLGLLLSFLPFSEIRGGLIVLTEYAVRNSVSIWPWFFLAVIINIFGFLFALFFLDELNHFLLRWRFYERHFERYVEKAHIKGHQLKKQMDKWGYIALAIFIAVPLPGTGAWTGALITWLFDFDRKKSLIACIVGVLGAGLISLAIIFGFFQWLY